LVGWNSHIKFPSEFGFVEHARFIWFLLVYNKFETEKFKYSTEMTIVHEKKISNDKLAATIQLAHPLISLYKNQ
jgi:hypothetical protein